MLSVALLRSTVYRQTACSSGPTGMVGSVISAISGRDSEVVSKEKLLADS